MAQKLSISIEDGQSGKDASIAQTGTPMSKIAASLIVNYTLTGLEGKNRIQNKGIKQFENIVCGVVLIKLQRFDNVHVMENVLFGHSENGVLIGLLNCKISSKTTV